MTEAEGPRTRDLRLVRGEERDADEEARLPVVVGVGAATSDAAIAYAFEAAAGGGVELVAVRAWRDVGIPVQV